ncbi:MAG: sensor histidine kinase [Bacteroidota bacterium]
MQDKKRCSVKSNFIRLTSHFLLVGFVSLIASISSVAQQSENSLSDSLLLASATFRTDLGAEDRMYWAERIIYFTEKLYPKEQLADTLDELAYLSEIYGNWNYAEALFRRSLVIRKNSGEVEYAKGLLRLSGSLKEQAKYIELLSYLPKSIELLESDSRSNGRLLGIAYNLIGEVYNQLGEYELSLSFLNKSLNKRTPNSSGMANTYLNLAGLYINMRRYEKALENSKISLTLFENLDIAEGAAKACINIGTTYYKQEQDLQALQFYDKALSYKNIPDWLIVQIKNNIRAIWVEQERYDEALEAYMEDLEKVGQNLEQQTIATLNIANIHYRKDAYETATTYYKAALNHAQNMKNKQLAAETMRRMIDNYILLRDADASIAYIDSLAVTADELKINYTAAMNKEINQMATKKLIAEQQKLTAEKESQQSRIAALTTGILALIGMFTAIFVTYREKVKRRAIEEKRAQEVKEMMLAIQLKSTEAKLEGVLEERKRVSEDIHDSVGVMLSSTKLHFESLSKRLDNMEQDQRKRFDRAFDMLSLAQKETRRVVHDMANLTLEQHGLKAQIEELVQAVQANNFNIEFKTKGLKGRIDQNIANQLYKIVQELIGNTIKHADASQLDIQLERIENELALSVQDNGKGIGQIKDSTLRAVKGRVKDLGANLTIDSSKSTGTKVLIDQIYLN